MANAYVDFSKKLGKIKPVHGVNAGPETKVFTYDAKPLFREAAIPLSRLHDTEYPYGSGEFVDIPCIFKNFDADENDPANYNFSNTDLYIAKILEVGAKVLFRLGVSIEHSPAKRYVFPPKDFEKWARICEHIIRHYTEGWADGYNWGIEYWEIWNEADGGENMWNGTPEQFYEFYTIAAKHLKVCFPKQKIGGPAFCRAKNPFTEGFLKYISEKKAPLDFYSWHLYFESMEMLKEEIENSVELLTKYGYADAENIMDEWNLVENWSCNATTYKLLTGEKGAAYCAAVLTTLQKSPVDTAAYFEADPVKEWCGLFEVDRMAIGMRKFSTVKPRKPFYAFKTFGDLYRLGTEVESGADKSPLYLVAATDGRESEAMLTLYGSSSQGPLMREKGGSSTTNLTLSGLPKNAKVEISLMDECTDLSVFAVLDSSEKEVAYRGDDLAFDGLFEEDRLTLKLPVTENTIWRFRVTAD